MLPVGIGRVLWASLIAGFVGVVLGLFVRAPAVIAVAAVAVACSAIAGAALSWSAWTTALWSLAPVVAVEAGYLAGLAMRDAWQPLILEDAARRRPSGRSCFVSEGGDRPAHVCPDEGGT
jgi:hypothetical protein